ncbi:MAG: TonB-dependent receptor [Gemmatimonadaceae bacterium]|nr:TonB-dependent receptor [Gemmatimonadaceae bacterium]
MPVSGRCVFLINALRIGSVRISVGHVLAASLLLLSAPRIASAQERGVRGVVRHDSSGAPLARVTVSVDGIPQSVLTDSTGRFAIMRLPRGTLVVRARRVGFTAAEQPVSIRDGQIAEVELRLVPSSVTLDAVRTTAAVSERERFDGAPATASTTISANVLTALPAVGEPDVLRVAQLLPGVVARNDFTTGLNVRGGEQDQNLVLLDGIPLFQPFHLGGVFGTFIESAVGGLRLHAGAPPVEFGTRLSSVLEVSSSRDARRGVHGEVQTSLLASTLALSGADASTRRSWNVAVRRTYADQIASALADRELPYAFLDGHAHFSWARASGGTFTFTAYHGRDRLREDFMQREDTLRLDSPYALDWGNDAAGITWTQPLGTATSFVQRASVSRFVSQQDEGAGTSVAKNDVREWRASGLLRSEHGSHLLGVGYEVAQHDVMYREGSPQLATTFEWRVQRPVSAVLLADDTWKLGSSFVLRPGVRFERLSGAGWSGISPRIAARWFTTSNTALTATIGRTTQWLHALREEEDALRFFDRWVMADSTVPVASATQGALEFEHWLSPRRFLRIEVFAKHYGALVERNPLDARDVRGDEFRPITGKSRGFDVLLRQVETGAVSGWLAYTFSHNTRTDGVSTWRPAQDRRHTVNAVGTWRTRNGTVLSGRLGFGSGIPYTGLETQLVRRIADPRANRWDRGVVERDVQGVGGERNAAMLPSVVRLDLSVQRTLVRGRLNFTPVLGVINATNRRNVYAYRFDYRQAPAIRESLSQLPIIPTLGVTVGW